MLSRINSDDFTLGVVTMLPLESAIAPTLKAVGFKKKARTWWRARAEVIDVVNLQKSEFNDQLYVNLGVNLRSLGAESMPPERRCHIRARLERIADASLFEDIRSAEAQTMPTAGLLGAIASDAMTWFTSLSTISSIKATVATPQASKWFIHVNVRQL